MLSTQKKYPGNPQEMAYIDLFAGPGKYDDQSKSTPMMVIETILSNPELAERVVTRFNDKDEKNIQSLKIEIAQIEGIEKLKHPPEFSNAEVGDEVENIFGARENVPTFFFVDPWGYKGLSLKLVSSFIKNWGCECVLFFNYNRVNMGINNEAVEKHVTSLFEKQRLVELRDQLQNIGTSEEREVVVVQALFDALKQHGSEFVLPFRFKNSNGARTSHHLIFLTKHFRGYEIMKEIMAKESTDTKDGVANFEYNPRDVYYKQGTIFDLLTRPLDELQGELLEQYAGRTINFMDLYEEHSVNRPYIKKNYREILRKMFEAGLISAVNRKTNEPPPQGKFPDEMRITFGGTE